MNAAVYIQANRKQALAARVAARSFRRTSEQPLEVNLVHFEEFPALTSRDGQRYLRDGMRAVWRNDHLQSFTPLRFVVPQLRGYQGRALVVDPDVFALTDVHELLEVDMQGAAILVRQVGPKPERPRPYFDTSVMLLDCERLQHWRWEDRLDDLFSMRLDYRTWMTLSLEPPGTIGLLGEQWNRHDRLEPDTKLLHTTRMITQPWKTGLPLDFVEVWERRTPRELVRWARTKLRHRGQRYEAHPDPRQEQLFFDLLGESLAAGEITEAEVQEAIGDRQVRADALERIRRLV